MRTFRVKPASRLSDLSITDRPRLTVHPLSHTLPSTRPVTAFFVDAPDYGVFPRTLSTSVCWTTVILTSVVALFPRLVGLFAWTTFHPSLIDETRLAARKPPGRHAAGGRIHRSSLVQQAQQQRQALIRVDSPAPARWILRWSATLVARVPQWLTRRSSRSLSFTAREEDDR